MNRALRHIASRIGAVTLVAAALWLAAPAHAFAEKRVALVIGMSKYQNVPQLTNPTNDAAAMTEVFRKAGFTSVVSLRDLTVSDMRRAVREFSEAARDADIAVMYYAGHGIEVDRVNYLIPADARLISDFDVEDETVSLDRVLKAMEPAKQLKLVILDACRDNPFAKSMKRSIGTRSVGRGLAEVDPGGSNTLIAYAAPAGAVAADGDGANSPFAAALVKYLPVPGLDMRIALGRVRDEVRKVTGNRQDPYVYGSLGGDTVSLVPAAAAPAPPPPDPNAGARRDYELAAQIGTKDAWNLFLAAHPTGLYAGLAKAQNDKLKAAEQVSSAAEDAKRKADDQARQKAEDFRRQLEEQSAKQTEDARKKISEQSKQELEVARQQVAEQAKRELDEARRQAEEAKRQADDARKQVEQAKQQAVDDAQRQVEKAKAEAKAAAQKQADDAAKQQAALLEQLKAGQAKLDQAKADQAKTDQNKAGNTQVAMAPSSEPVPVPPVVSTPPVAAVPQMDPADIARLLQAHLKRVGCDPGGLDGNWTSGSQKALDNFNKNAKTTLDIKLASLDALDAVRGKTGRVCPLLCKSGEKADGDRCVAITCEPGYMLSDGACKKRPEPVERKKVARDEAPAPRVHSPAPAAPSGGGGGGGKCFAFNGKRYCE